MFALYHDEDSLSRALLHALRRAGFDCLTVAEAGMRGRSDAEQLAYAAQRGRVLFTENGSDFRRLDSDWWRLGREHAGIVLLTDHRTPIAVQARAFIALAAKVGDDGLFNRVEFLLNHA